MVAEQLSKRFARLHAVGTPLLLPEPIQEEQPQEQAAAPSEPQTQQPTGIEQQWRSYRVEAGKTLAQLFRDHNLPPTDVYAMAQVEGFSSNRPGMALLLLRVFFILCSEV